MSVQKRWEWRAGGVVIADGPGLVVFVWHRREAADGGVLNSVTGWSIRLLLGALKIFLKGKAMT